MRINTFSALAFAVIVSSHPAYAQTANRSTPTTPSTTRTAQVEEAKDVRTCRRHCDGLRAGGTRVTSASERAAQQTTCAKKMVKRQ
jgi:hypothetical protein